MRNCRIERAQSHWKEFTDYIKAGIKGIRAAFPETPEGQKQWFQAVNEIVMAAPYNLGRGVFWWEPMQRGRGCFDDQTRKAKPILEAFEKYAFPLDRTDGNPRIWDFEEGERP